jgi:hypothetical protein
MSPETLGFSTVHRLAKRLERDIRLKSLAPGDRYLTASQAAHMLGCSRTVASRALYLLGERDVVIRRRGQGSVVGPALQGEPSVGRLSGATGLQSILLLEPSDLMKVTQIRPEVMFSLVRRRFEPAAVHLISLPEVGTADYVRRLVEPRRQAGERMGVIALSCPRSVYAYLVDCGVPAVVLGSLYPDLRASLPSVDLDNFQAGQLLVQYLVERGRTRLGLLLGFAGRAGTDDLLNGVLAGMHAANLSPAALAARFYPGSEEGLRAQVRELLSMPHRPTALIVSDVTTARWASEVAADFGLSVPGDLEIGYLQLGDADSTSEFLPCPHAYPRESLDRMFAQAVEMLWRQLQGIPQVSHNVSIPISIRGSGTPQQGAPS